MNDNLGRLLSELSDIPCDREFYFRNHTTIRIGGKARAAYYPQTEEELCRILGTAEKFGIPAIILGFGSNVLVSDKGFGGVVILTRNLRRVYAEGNVLCAECGAATESVLSFAGRRGLGGFSFMAGIPSTVGGAVYMNAGIQGGYIGERVTEVTVYKEGVKKIYTQPQCGFSYKHTRFMEENSVILSACFSLDSSLAETIAAETEKIRKKRASLPKGYSMGCVFKNPLHFSAGKLIEEAGLKGLACGGAYVSEEHANFIINRNDATARDVVWLIQTIKKKVRSETGIELAEEIRYIGEF